MTVITSHVAHCETSHLEDHVKNITSRLRIPGLGKNEGETDRLDFDFDFFFYSWKNRLEILSPEASNVLYRLVISKSKIQEIVFLINHTGSGDTKPRPL